VNCASDSSVSNTTETQPHLLHVWLGYTPWRGPARGGSPGGTNEHAVGGLIPFQYCNGGQFFMCSLTRPLLCVSAEASEQRTQHDERWISDALDFTECFQANDGMCAAVYRIKIGHKWYTAPKSQASNISFVYHELNQTFPNFCNLHPPKKVSRTSRPLHQINSN
jgi:hypothetical protein